MNRDDYRAATLARGGDLLDAGEVPRGLEEIGAACEAAELRAALAAGDYWTATREGDAKGAAEAARRVASLRAACEAFASEAVALARGRLRDAREARKQWRVLASEAAKKT